MFPATFDRPGLQVFSEFMPTATWAWLSLCLGGFRIGAGALIDASKANEIVEAIDDQAKASMLLTAALTANTAMAGKLHDQLGETRTDVREMTKAMDRLREEMRIRRETAKR